MIIEKLEEIISTLEASREEAQKAETGNASAGRRLRKVCMEAAKELKELRAIVLEQSKK
tara:strand:+ start:359 stop:535 length:177 start_codon:yes stop_codon:yes gene_type:complete